MIRELNGFVLTDPDCLQYCKKISDTVFDLVEFWEYPDGSGCVHGSCIDLSDYEEKHIISVLSGYYDANAIKNIKSQPGWNQIISECIFESEGVIDSGWVVPVDSFEHADEIITEYINEV